jgi:hypothetical protein
MKYRSPDDLRVLGGNCHAEPWGSAERGKRQTLHSLLIPCLSLQAARLSPDERRQASAFQGLYDERRQRTPSYSNEELEIAPSHSRLIPAESLDGVSIHFAASRQALGEVRLLDPSRSFRAACCGVSNYARRKCFGG